MNRFKKDQNINNKPYSVKRNLPAIVHTVKALKTNIIVRQFNQDIANIKSGVTAADKVNPVENPPKHRKLFPERKIRDLRPRRITRKKRKSRAWMYYNILKNYKRTLLAIPEEENHKEKTLHSGLPEV